MRDSSAAAPAVEPESTELLERYSSALFEPRLNTQRTSILRLALAQNWPVVAGSAFADERALLSYGADGAAIYRRAAHHVDRILKGAKPGDLPIEQPMTFELVVNLKTAKALQLTIPAEIMVRATRVIR